MKKPAKILLAAATVWPFLYMILFMLFIFSFIFMARGGRPGGGASPDLFLLIFPLHFLTMLVIMGLMVFYIVDVFRNERVEKDKKALWAVVLFMGSMFAMPVYWYLYIWREEKGPHAPGSLNQAGAFDRGNSAAPSGREEDYVRPPQPPDWRG